MKNHVHVFKKSISLVLAMCILFSSCFTFQGCNGYEEDYSVLKENDQMPKVSKSDKLSDSHEIIINLKKSITAEKKIDNGLKSTNLNEIELKFGVPLWDESRLITYDNGMSGIYVPIIKDEKVTAFFMSRNRNDKFKTIIIEVLPELEEKAEYFSGRINFYYTNCKKISSYSYENGKYAPELKSTNSQIVRLKSITTEGENCDWNCIYPCFNSRMTSDWIYTTGCTMACAAWETMVGLIVCIACVGGPALMCIDECCW